MQELLKKPGGGNVSDATNKDDKFLNLSNSLLIYLEEHDLFGRTKARGMSKAAN